MKKLLKRGLYLMKAKGRHGTHSPFVYAFVEQVLRAKASFKLAAPSSYFSNREISLLGKALLHLKPNVVYAEDTLKTLLADLTTANTSLTFTVGSIGKIDDHYEKDGLFVCFPTTENIHFLQHQFSKQSHAAIILHQPSDKDFLSRREALYQDEHIKMVMELWSFSYLSNHSDFKVKQFFRLR